jgi:hypothetical protein
VLRLIPRSLRAKESRRGPVAGKGRLTDGEELARPRADAEAAADALRAKAAQILERAVGLRELTKGTPAWYAATRTRVEARRRVRLNEGDARQG